jgi:hypothetical protein
MERKHESDMRQKLALHDCRFSHNKDGEGKGDEIKIGEGKDGDGKNGEGIKDDGGEEKIFELDWSSEDVLILVLCWSTAERFGRHFELFVARKQEPLAWIVARRAQSSSLNGQLAPVFARVEMISKVGEELKLRAKGQPTFSTF